MLVLTITLYQFYVTVGHLSSLNYLLVSILYFAFGLASPSYCSPYVSVRLCITFLALYYRFLVTSLFLFLFLPFISQPCITVH